jgi:hypothetical protein
MAMAQKMNALNRDPVTLAGNTALIALKLGIAIIEIWAGASLLGLKPAARIWIMGFAVADIIVGIAALMFTILFIQPKMLATMQQAGSSVGGPQIGSFMQVSVYAGDFIALLLLVWPLLILYFMSRPIVKAAFGASPG